MCTQHVMMRLYLAIYTILCVVLLAAADVRERKFLVPHVGVNGTTTLRITMWKRRGVSTRQPAVFIVPGALVLSASYRGFAQALSKRGFTVFAADYTSRFIGPQFTPIVEARIAAGFACPRLGNFPSVSALHTMARFAKASGCADVSRAVLFGHSLGAVIAARSFYRACAPPRPGDIPEPPPARNFLCDADEGAIPPYTATVVALFGGLTAVEKKHPRGTLLLALRSQFESDSVLRASSWLKSGASRAVDVEMGSKVNHFAPNDFAPAFQHRHTNCSVLVEGKGAAFRTTAAVQAHVVHSLANIVAKSFYVYKGGGDAAVQHIARAIRRERFVKSSVVAGSSKLPFDYVRLSRWSFITSIVKSCSAHWVSSLYLYLNNLQLTAM